MAQNFPPAPGYITATDLEQAISALKYKHPQPLAPQARIELSNNGETLELGEFEITASPVQNGLINQSSPNTLTIKSAKTKKTFITITEDEIIIGDVNAEHIRLKQ